MYGIPYTQKGVEAGIKIYFKKTCRYGTVSWLSGIVVPIDQEVTIPFSPLSQDFFPWRGYFNGM